MRRSRQFEDVFRRDKITYQIVGGLRFYDRKEIKDILSYLKVVLNPADSVGIKRIINVPARGIGKTTIEKLEQYHAANPGTARSGTCLMRAATDTSIVSAAVSKKLTQFVGLLNRLMQEQPKLLLSELYHLILDETGYVRDLRAEGTEEALDRVENLEEFDNVLQEFEEDFFARRAAKRSKPASASTSFFPRSSSSRRSHRMPNQKDSNLDQREADDLHSSKGLEFPVVFLVGMEEGLFPSVKAWEEEAEEDVEEERRLCYVGMTRAREQLYLTQRRDPAILGKYELSGAFALFRRDPEESGRVQGFLESSERLFVTVCTSVRLSRGDTGRGLLAAINRPRLRSRSNPFVGRRVRHPEYGDGTVLALRGAERIRRSSSSFRGREQRKFLLRYVASFFD